MSAKHSPLPWKCTRECIIDNANAPVAECDALALSQRMDEANAAFIVRAVNAHDELIAALERIAAFDDVMASNHLAQTGSYAQFDEPASVEIARAALAKAKVQP